MALRSGYDAAMMSLNRGLLGGAVAAHTLAWWLGVRPVALDPDAMNLAYGMHRFDITHFTPHAPGYLVYIWTLRAAHFLRGGAEQLTERFATVQLVSLLFGLAAIVTAYLAARRMKLPDGAAGWTASILAVHPILVFHSVDAQTHTSEAFASALLLLVAIAYRQDPGWRRALALGLVLAFGSAFRPSFVLFGAPVIIWTIGIRRFGNLALAGVASIVGALGWVLPTVAASGGWETWRSATRGLVHHGFVLTSSPFSDTAVGSLVSANQRSLALWAFEVALPPLVALAVASSGRDASEPGFAGTPMGRWLSGALLVGGGFTLAYYAATFVSEPGYLAALLPPVALFVGGSTCGNKGARPAALALTATLACWALPILPHVLKVPSVAEWQRRTDLALAYADHMERSLPDAGPYLAIVGHPDITVGRQLPMLEPRVDVLLVHDGRRPWIARTSLTYVTELDSVPIPEAFGPPEAGASLDASRSYSGVWFDGSLAPHFQTQLVARSRCDARPATDVTEVVVLPIECFEQGGVSLDDLELRFGLR